MFVRSLFFLCSFANFHPDNIISQPFHVCNIFCLSFIVNEWNLCAKYITRIEFIYNICITQTTLVPFSWRKYYLSCLGFRSRRIFILNNEIIYVCKSFFGTSQKKNQIPSKAAAAPSAVLVVIVATEIVLYCLVCCMIAYFYTKYPRHFINFFTSMLKQQLLFIDGYKLQFVPLSDFEWFSKKISNIESFL